MHDTDWNGVGRTADWTGVSRTADCLNLVQDSILLAGCCGGFLKELPAQQIRLGPNRKQALSHSGGFTPSIPTATAFAVTMPPWLAAQMKTAALGFSSALSPGGKRTAGCDGKHEKATIHCKFIELEVGCPSS